MAAAIYGSACLAYLSSSVLLLFSRVASLCICVVCFTRLCYDGKASELIADACKANQSLWHVLHVQSDLTHLLGCTSQKGKRGRGQVGLKEPPCLIGHVVDAEGVVRDDRCLPPM